MKRTRKFSEKTCDRRLRRPLGLFLPNSVIGVERESENFLKGERWSREYLASPERRRLREAD